MINGVGHFTYMRYNARGELASSCEYESVG